MSEQPKVVYLTPGCFDKGGISRYSRYQIRALRELVGASNVRALSVLGPTPHSFEQPFETSYFAGGVAGWDKLRFSMAAFALTLRERPTLIVAAHLNLALPAALLAMVAGAKTLLNVYGLEVWTGHRASNVASLKRVDALISDCHFTAGYVEREGYRPPGSTRVIWDCVDLDRFNAKPASLEVLARYGIPDPAEHFNVLTLGRISRAAAHKGYERLLAAFRLIANRFPTMRVIFAGEGNLVPELQRGVRASGLADRVHFTGAIDERSLPDVYRSAAVFSLVSDRGVGRGEGLPLTPLEAGACGVPILVGDQDGSSEAIQGGNGFAIPSLDIERHAERLAELASNVALRDTMARSAVATAERFFSFRRFRDEHERLLESLFRSGHATAR